MKKQTAKKKDSEEKKGLEVISVKIGSSTPATYKGLGGTFASFTDSCLRKQTLPGFNEKGLIAEAEPKDVGLVLCLSGKRSETKLQEVMDTAYDSVYEQSMKLKVPMRQAAMALAVTRVADAFNKRGLWP